MIYFFSLGQTAAILAALVTSLQQRFWLSALGAVLRIGIAIASAWVAVQVGTSIPALLLRPAPAEALPAGGLGSIGPALAVLGPALSLAMFVIAQRRAKASPAEQEKTMRRPANAWLVVLLFDAAFATIAAFGLLLIAD